MKEKDLGRKIQEARLRSGYKQEEVEIRLDLPQKSMTRMESGQRIPTTLELVKLAELFHQPISDFFNPKQDEDPLIALYRVAPGLEQDISIRNEINRCIHLCKEAASLVTLLESPNREKLVSYNLKRPTTLADAIKQGEYVAKEEQKRLEIGNLPVNNIVEILSSQGILCAATSLPKEVSGMCLHHSSLGGTVILVNADHIYARKRFSYAHEYAHALLDTDQNILVTDIENTSDLRETRANAFAAAFLMSEHGIIEAVRMLNKGAFCRTSFAVLDVSTQEPIEAEERQIAQNQKLSYQDVAFIAYRFGVSYQAAIYRLHSLRYLSKESREELLEEEPRGKEYLRALGMGEFEQIDKNQSLQRELKSYISQLVIEAYQQEKISRGRVLELSKILQIPAQYLLETL